jgi:anti-sigma B factor antagonist
MEITQRAVNDKTCVITLNGALNAASSEQVKGMFRKVVGEGTRQIVLDLGKVHFIDSSGLAALISGLKTLNGENSCLKLAALQPQAELLFKLTMFDKVFRTYPDVGSALKDCQA